MTTPHDELLDLCRKTGRWAMRIGPKDPIAGKEGAKRYRVVQLGAWDCSSHPVAAGDTWAECLDIIKSMLAPKPLDRTPHDEGGF